MDTQSLQNESAPLDDLSSDKGTASPLRILLVEDNLETATMLRYLLEYEGYQVTELNSGRDAMELVAAVDRGEDAPFDVALLDIMLPFADGYEVCQEIRRTERLGYIPIIMVTALRSTEDMVRGLDLGADDYLVKPFNHRELLARVRAALRVRDADRAMRLRNWQLAVLNKLNDAIGGSLLRDEVLRASLKQVLQDLELAYVMAFLPDRHEGDIRRVLYCDGKDWFEERIAHPSDPTGDPDKDVWRERSVYGLACDVVESGQRRWQTSGQGWPVPPEESGTRQDWRACVPLRAKPPKGLRQTWRDAGSVEPARDDPIRVSRQVLGVLLVGAPTEKPMMDLHLLTAIGNQIGQALEKCRFHQQARERSEELAALFDSISDAIYVVDNQYRIAALNAALRRWLGERQDDATAQVETLMASVAGQICYRTLHGRDAPCDGCRVESALCSGEHIQWTEQRRSPDRRREEWEISAYPIQGHRGAASQAIILARDVTARRMLEASLSQSEKLAALGQLAAGLAHEINNPLTAIVANAQLMLLDTKPDDLNYESLGLIKQASDRAVKVVRNLLDFSRQEQYEFRPTELNATLCSALELVKHQFLIARVKVLEDLGPDLPSALVSQDHLQGVWLNLLLNARDAVTQQVRSDFKARVWVSSRLRNDGQLEVAIRDNGAGIPPDQLKRIFEPFFTTKDPGKGTGLGLSTSYHVVKQHGGEILIDSDLDSGTTLTVLLPAVDE